MRSGVDFSDPESNIGFDDLSIRENGAESFGRIDQLHRAGDHDLAITSVASGEEVRVPIARAAIQSR